MLRGFCENVGGNVECDAVGEAQAVSYLAGNGPLTRSRANKYGALAGFWRYAISRGYATRSPLPAPEDEPRQPRSAPPYVYSPDELQRLFAAIDIRWQRPVQLDRDTLRALLLLLYGAGLRFGEAQRLTLSDVNLTDAILKLNDVDPQAWFADALARIAELPHTRVHELLPWNWKAARHQSLAA